MLYNQAMNTIQNYSPRAILAAPSEVFRLVNTFFATYIEEGKPPTPASLAAYLGFASRTQMMNVFKEPERYPQESVHYIAHTLTRIEAHLSEEGLMDNVNVTMAKFLMSATLDVVEKKEVKSTDNNVQINILGVDNPERVMVKQVTVEDL